MKDKVTKDKDAEDRMNEDTRNALKDKDRHLGILGRFCVPTIVWNYCVYNWSINDKV